MKRIDGWWFARLLAYVLVIGAAAFAVVRVVDEADRRNQALRIERIQTTDSILSSLAQGSVNGCVSFNESIYNDRAQLLDSRAEQPRAYAPLIAEGTLSQAQVDRLIAQSEILIKRYLDRSNYRDCEKSAERYISKITDKTVKASERKAAMVQATAASQEIDRLEAEDEQRRERDR